MIYKKQLKVFYIFTMIVAMSFRFPIFSTPWFTPYIHCAIWIIIGCIVRKNNYIYDPKLNRCLGTLKFAFLSPYVIFWMISIPAYLIYSNSFEINVFTRAISTTLQFLLIAYSVYSTALIFKEKLIKYTFISLVLSYAIVIIMTICKYGINEFISIGLLPFSEKAGAWVAGGNASNALEHHDLCFSMGFFIIYYIVWKEEKKNIAEIIFSVAIFYLGFKKIGIAGVLGVFVLLLLFRKNTKTSVKVWSVIITMIILIVSLGFVYVIKNNLISLLASKYDLSIDSRLEIYSYMTSFFEFSPFYFGRGFAASSKINENAINVGYRLIQGHSDILFSYIDYGFWGTSLWIVWTVHYVTRKIQERHGSESAKIWLLFTVYAFVTYFSDNTTKYFAFQSVYMIIMMKLIYTNDVIDSGNIRKPVLKVKL